MDKGFKIYYWNYFERIRYVINAVDITEVNKQPITNEIVGLLLSSFNNNIYVLVFAYSLLRIIVTISFKFLCTAILLYVLVIL